MENGEKQVEKEGEEQKKFIQENSKQLMLCGREPALPSFHVSYVQKFWMQTLNLQGIILSDKQREGGVCNGDLSEQKTCVQQQQQQQL